MKFTKSTLDKIERIFEEQEYVVRYEKGNFNSGYCLVEDKKIAVINKFFDVEARINVLLDILSTIQINEALMTMEQLPPQAWRIGPDDARTSIFPPGTRARASGQNVIYTIPGHGEVLQAAEANQAWNFLQWSFGTDFPAQERSWGFVVRSGAHWDKLQPRQRALTILHEFYHQHMQMRQWLLGWTLVYWPAYQVTFPFTGWHDHWAEMGGPHAAGVVDRALGAWSQI